MNLRLYITKDDYNVQAGQSWPSYDDLINGVKTKDKRINTEIDNFIESAKRTGIKFPINTQTSCQSKWTWSTIYLNSLSTASCHRVNPIKFNLNDFDNFHNIPKKIQDRNLMLKGKWPTGGCEYCKNIEDAGGFSDRMHNLEIRGLTPPELEHDQQEVNVTPRIVEIFAQNTCNLQCTYCNASLSSKIELENKKFGTFDKNGVYLPVVNIPQATDQYFEKFLLWLEKNILVLRRLHLLGGETFLQHNLLTSVLRIIENNPNQDLEFCIFSNMNVPDKIWNNYIPKIKDLQNKKHIKCFDLTASIDCWGPEAEYARFGLNLRNFEDRMWWASDQDDWLRFNVNQTVTCLTIKTMPELINKINYYSKNKHIGHYFQFYTGSEMYQHPQIFAYDMWEESFNDIYKSMPTRTIHQREAIPRMQGLQKQLQLFKKHNYVEINKLHIYLDELDRRRKTNWRNIFPYLDINDKT